MEESPLCFAALGYIYSLSGAREEKRGKKCEKEVSEYQGLRRGNSSGGNCSGCSFFHLCQIATMICWRTPATGTAKNPPSNPKSSAPAKSAKRATMGGIP